MTITRATHSIEYDITATDAGRVEFPFDFSASEAGQIHCFDIDPAIGSDEPGNSTEIPASGFTVAAATGGLAFGGAVTLAAPLAVGHVLRIQRITSKTQERVFRNQKSIDPAQVEAALDKVTQMVQEVQAEGNEPLIADINSLKEDSARQQNEIDGLKTSKADASALNNYATKGDLAAKADATDPRLSNARAPTAHAASHAMAGADRITPEAIGALKPPPGDGKKYLVAATGYVEYIAPTGDGGSGTTDHSELVNRDAPDQHPQSAIQHLEPDLETIRADIAAKADEADMLARLQTKADAASLAGKADANHAHAAATAEAAGFLSAADKAKLDGLDARVDAKQPLVNFSTGEQDTGLKWVDGKKIYRKTINTGALVNNGTKTVAHGIPSFSMLVQAYGWASNGTQYLALPWAGSSPAGIFVDATNVNVSYGGTATNGSSSVTIFYTCTDR